MGTYKLSYKEIKESFDEWLWSLEGDFDVKDIVKAFNSIARKESWKERIKIINIKSRKDAD